MTASAPRVAATVPPPAPAPPAAPIADPLPPPTMAPAAAPIPVRMPTFTASCLTVDFAVCSCGAVDISIFCPSAACRRTSTSDMPARPLMRPLLWDSTTRPSTRAYFSAIVTPFKAKASSRGGVERIAFLVVGGRNGIDQPHLEQVSGWQGDFSRRRGSLGFQNSCRPLRWRSDGFGYRLGRRRRGGAQGNSRGLCRRRGRGGSRSRLSRRRGRSRLRLLGGRRSGGKLRRRARFDSGRLFRAFRRLLKDERAEQRGDYEQQNQNSDLYAFHANLRGRLFPKDAANCPRVARYSWRLRPRRTAPVYTRTRAGRAKKDARDESTLFFVFPWARRILCGQPPASR